MDASFEEKSTWVTLLGLVAVFGFYFVVAARMLAAGVTEPAPFLPLLIVTIVLLVVVLAVGHTVAALVGGRPEGRDERDRLISWRAEHNSGWLLGAGVVAAIFALGLPVGRAWVANGLLLALLLSEILAYGLRLYYYRRGM